MKKKILLLFLILLLLFVPTVYASISTGFLPKAQKYIDNTCVRKHLANDQSLFCYLFYKVHEHDTAISNINTTISPIPNEVADLQNKVSSQSSGINSLDLRVTNLEKKQPLPPFDFVFFNGSIVTGDVASLSPIADVQEYSKITFTYQAIHAHISLQVSNDKTNWLEQYSSPSSPSSNGSVTLSTAARYYYITANRDQNFSSGTVNAFAQFSN